MIRRAFITLDEEVFLCLFKAFVRPHLEYANAVWNPYKRKDVTALENERMLELSWRIFQNKQTFINYSPYNGVQQKLDSQHES